MPKDPRGRHHPFYFPGVNHTLTAELRGSAEKGFRPAVCDDFRYCTSLPSNTWKNPVMQDTVKEAHDLSLPRDMDITSADTRSNSFLPLNISDNDEFKGSVPRSLASVSLDEKFLREMPFLMKSSRGRILVQAGE